MKIIRCDLELETPNIDSTLRKWGHELILLPDNISEDELCSAMGECELLLMCYTPISSRVIASAPRLKGIVKYGVGIDAIDIPAAHNRGVSVVNIPTYAEETVAEGAFAMLISLAKKLIPLQKELRTEGWAWPTARWLGSDIAEKTVGIVGCGKIGSSLARMAGVGFRSRVVGYDPYKSPEELHDLGIEAFDNLHDMLSICDFVSLHVALSDSTKHLIGTEELAAMKSTAILINTARGALIDENALLNALQEGSIAGAGLDVFSQEPLNLKNHPLKALYSMDNVILTPHLAFYTKEAMDRLEAETLERCQEIIEGRSVTIRSTDSRLQGNPA